MLLVAFSELMYALSSGSNSDFRVHWSVSVSVGVCVCVLCASFKLSKFLFHFIQFGFYSIQLASVKSIDCTMVLYPTKIESFAGFSASTQSKMICAISMNQFADKHMQILQCISHRKYEHRNDMKVMQLSCFLKSFGFCMSFVCILDPNTIDSVAQFYDYRILFKYPNAILSKHMKCEMISSPSHSLGLSFRDGFIKFTPYFVHIGPDISGLKGQFYRTSFIEFTNESDWFDNIVVGILFLYASHHFECARIVCQVPIQVDPTQKKHAIILATFELHRHRHRLFAIFAV